MGPKKRWIVEVVQLLLQLYLSYAHDYGTGVNGSEFLEAKQEGSDIQI
jgi:hypothetical protein